MALNAGFDVRAVLERFGVPPDAEVHPHIEGLINASYRVRGRGVGSDAGYLLQRLNPRAFRDSGAVMRNFVRLTTHLDKAAAEAGIVEPERRVMRLVPASSGDPMVIAGDGACWRLLRFIPRTRTIAQVRNSAEAREVGSAFGLFHRLAATYDGPGLETTIPDLHNTGRHVDLLEEVVRVNPVGRAATVEPEISLVRRHASLASVLLDGAPRTRLAHNDAKPANVLLDADSGAGLAIVDLDTVMPGTILHDVGDLIRSASCTVAEDEGNLGGVRVEPSLLLAMASGFLTAGGPGLLDDTERELVIPAGLAITYEQAVRFLADHLAGDTYYRISRSGQNLDRARVQLRLLESLLALRDDLERALRDLAGRLE